MPSETGSDRSPPQASAPSHDAATAANDHAGAASVPDPVPSAPTQPPDLLSRLRPPRSGDELGRLANFSIRKVLGQGGMGAVFEAHDLLIRLNVALKVMRPELTARPESYQRFLREARTAGAVEHDHIIPVHQVGEDNGVLFIAMPLLQGEALDRRLAREQRLPIPAILKIGRETAEGLAAAHERGLMHRDIKPGNLWLEGTDDSAAGFRRVKVLDFGLARAVHEDTHLTAAGGVLGTPTYMAPEQADGQTVDHRADLFSLGAVLYRCCTGVSPFAGPSTMAILSALANKTPVPVREKNPDVPPALADLIMRLLAKAPADRPQTAAEVAATLRRIEQEYTDQPIAAVRRPRSRAPMIVLAAIVAMVLATAAGVIVVKVRGPDGKESEVTAPEGSKIAVDPQGKVTVTLPADVTKPAPAPACKPIAWLARVVKLPADEQVKEVTAELVRRNPGFNESLKVHKDDGGQVDEVVVVSTQLEDLSPFRGFSALGSLKVVGKDWNKLGRVRDLSCLKGMHLWCLVLSYNRVRDLSSLREMPLTDLFLECNPVCDLTPLQKIKLHRLGVNMTEVDDISSLRGMPLEYLSVHNTGVEDLSPLSKHPLKQIDVSAADIDPLSDLPLEYVRLIGDYRPEQIKLILRIPTMKEVHLAGNYTPEQLKEFRGNPLLKTINDKPAAEFWKAGDKAIPDKKGKAQAYGELGLAAVHILFHEWHLFRGGGSRAALQRELEPLREVMRDWLGEGARSGDGKALALCANLLAVEPALWTFLCKRGVEPTNNHMERLLRPGVLWRKNAFGSHSESGCRFVERMLTVVQTLRLQKRPILEFLDQSLSAHRRGYQAPRLLLEQ